MQHGDIHFGDFRIDPANEQLFAGDGERPLTPKAYNVLMFLIENAGTLVTKRDLLDAIWPEAIVGDAVLKVAVREIRKQLGDDSRNPVFIQTAHRRGYRFIHEVRRRDVSEESSIIMPAPRSAASELAESSIVERGAVDSLLATAWREARLGLRKIAFVVGGAGLGKTTIIESFSSRARRGREPAFVLQGACVETAGDVEEFACLLDAVGRGLREPGREVLRGLLRRYAPACLLRIPWALDDDERRELRQSVIGASAATLRRELADVLEALSRRFPVAVVLDDVQWADPATMDLLAVVAGRPHFPLLVVAGLRPEDAAPAVERVVRDLVGRGEAEEIVLEPLSEAGVSTYLAERLGVPGPDLAEFVVKRSEGVPLFLVNLVDDLLQRGEVDLAGGRARLKDRGRVEDHVPGTLERMIRARLDRLEAPSLAALEAASVAAAMGSSFSTLSVSAALEGDADELEELFESLWKDGQFIRQSAPLRFSDGTVAPSWVFAHGLYPRVIYAGLSDIRRIRYHQRIVRRGLELFESRHDEIAHEVAFHFERAGDAARAVEWWHRAARAASFAHRVHDAERMLTRALEPALDAGSAELATLCEARGLVRRAMGDVVGAERDFERMRAACAAAADDGGEVEALLLAASVRFWIDPSRALATVDEACRLAEESDDAIIRLHAGGYRGHLRLNLSGFSAAAAADCDEAVSTMRREGREARLAFHLTRRVWLDCCRSRHDRAAEAGREASRLNQELGNAFDFLLATFWWSWADAHAGRWGEACRRIDEGLELAERNAHRSWACLFGVLKAQLLCSVGAAEEADELCAAALDACGPETTGAGQIRDHAGIVRAQALIISGRPSEGLASLEPVEAHAARPGVLDQILFLPLRRTRCEALLALGRAGELAEPARDLVERAEAMGETGYAAVGRAFVAIAEGREIEEPAAAVAAPARARVLALARRAGRPPAAAEDLVRAELHASLVGWPELQDAWEAGEPGPS